jgi:hypothetical protein
MLQLRRTDEALDLLTEAVATRPAGDAKGRALVTLDLASCQLFIGEAGEAVRLVEQAHVPDRRRPRRSDRLEGTVCAG